MTAFDKCVIELSRAVGFELERGPGRFDIYRKRYRLVQNIAAGDVVAFLLKQPVVQNRIAAELVEGSQAIAEVKDLREELDAVQQSVAALSIGRRMMSSAASELDGWLDAKAPKPELTRALTGAQAYARGLPGRIRGFAVCTRCSGEGRVPGSAEPGVKEICKACRGQGAVEKKKKGGSR